VPFQSSPNPISNVHAIALPPHERFPNRAPRRVILDSPAAQAFFRPAKETHV
jgi:hypothetical protein